MCKIKHIVPEKETIARNFEIKTLKFSAEKRCLRYEENLTFFPERYVCWNFKQKTYFRNRNRVWDLKSPTHNI